MLCLPRHTPYVNLFNHLRSVPYIALIWGAKKIGDKIDLLLEQDDVTVELIAGAFVEFLIENDSYFRMMTHFMLYGVLNKESIQIPNGIEGGPSGSV